MLQITKIMLHTIMFVNYKNCIFATEIGKLLFDSLFFRLDNMNYG
jgi:hypothetical protein